MTAARMPRPDFGMSQMVFYDSHSMANKTVYWHCETQIYSRAGGFLDSACGPRSRWWIANSSMAALKSK